MMPILSLTSRVLLATGNGAKMRLHIESCAGIKHDRGQLQDLGLVMYEGQEYYATLWWDAVDEDNQN
jgi:hypothetical protein